MNQNPNDIDVPAVLRPLPSGTPSSEPREAGGERREVGGSPAATTVAAIVAAVGATGALVSPDTILGWTLAQVQEALDFAKRAGPIPRHLLTPPTPVPTPAPAASGPTLSDEERELLLDLDTMPMLNIVNAAIAWAREKSKTGAFHGMSASTARLYDRVQDQQALKGKHLKPRSKEAKKRAGEEG
jgi:hypothetical protein